jgi:hypothetical protein
MAHSSVASTLPGDLDPTREQLAERKDNDSDFATASRGLLVSIFCSNDKLAENFLPKLIEWYRSRDSLSITDQRILRETFQRLGTKAKDVGPVLIEDFDDSYSCDIIVKLGSDMVPLLIAKAKESLKDDRWRGLEYLQTLTKFGNHAIPALPLLLESLKSPEPIFRVALVKSLGDLTALSDKVVPELIKCLHDEKCIVRAAAASSLGNFIDHSDLIVPVLIAALKDEYADVRASALESLLKLGLKHPGVRDAVRLAQQDRHPYVRLLATEALDKK